MILLTMTNGNKIPLLNPTSSSINSFSGSSCTADKGIDDNEGTFVFTEDLAHQWWAAEFGKDMIVETVSVVKLGASYYRTGQDVINIAINKVRQINYTIEL